MATFKPETASVAPYVNTVPNENSDPMQKTVDMNNMGIGANAVGRPRMMRNDAMGLMHVAPGVPFGKRGA